jgi:hypothetical protein
MKREIQTERERERERVNEEDSLPGSSAVNSGIELHFRDYYCLHHQVADRLNTVDRIHL